ncbi:MAG: helix-turn-helix domain-containing protein [Zavarzinia sp.]|nr:helix-turn-helix domain-containing protein [Zavarzinia sp.]
MATISDAVGFNSTIHMFSTLRDLEVFSDLTVVVGDAQQGCTAQMIADITGLPRETVRRKLKKLVESGYLTTTEDGRYIHRPGILLEEPHVSAIFELEQITLEFINRCLATRVGDVKVIRADDEDASAGQ